MNYIIEGQISEVLNRQTYNKKGDEMVCLILTVPNKIVNDRMEYIKIDFLKEFASLPEEKNVSVGDMVQITFQLVGRKWNNKKTGKTEYFNNLQGLSISYR